VNARVAVDPELCIGSAECNRIAPAAFAIDESAGVSVPLPGAAETGRDVLVEAARNCPTNAITVVDADGTVLVRSAAG
jgi:ferredoxin